MRSVVRNDKDVRCQKEPIRNEESEEGASTLTSVICFSLSSWVLCVLSSSSTTESSSPSLLHNNLPHLFHPYFHSTKSQKRIILPTCNRGEQVSPSGFLPWPISHLPNCGFSIFAGCSSPDSGLRDGPQLLPLCYFFFLLRLF